jgi:membrane protein required for colicin V production
MTWIDLAAIIVVVLSLLLGVLRGLVRELFSLTAWVLAAVIAALYGPLAAKYVPPLIPGPLFATVAGFLIVFVVVLIVAGILGLVLGKIIRAAGLGAGDRFLGGVFGVLRGIIIMAIAVMVVGLTPLSKDEAWKSSMVVPPLESLVVAVRPYLPSVIAERVRVTLLGTEE